jgi:hypothetical protein
VADKDPDCIRTYSVLKVLNPKLDAKLQDYRIRLAAVKSGYPVLTDWHPVIPEGWGEFPPAPFERSVVYRGNAESWAYSHHQTITRFRDRYAVSWSNGFLHEDYVGQEVHCASSEDGAHWSDPSAVVHTPPETKLVRNNAGLYADDDYLYCYVGVAKDFGRDVAAPGMSVLKEQHIRLDVYRTSDLVNWEHFEDICGNIYLFEAPRRTRGGRLMCCGFDITDNHGMVLIWDDPTKPWDKPRVVDLRESPDGVLPEQGTWYQADDGRIWMYQRDSTVSCRLALTHSDDEGDTWSPLLRTDFPNSYSRAFAGRLADGRCYIIGNNYDFLLDRESLLIALSDNGTVFDRQYLLVEGHTTRRVNGRHKENGYHYPNAFPDGDKLLVTYSVNKEDIEVGILDTSKID